MVETGAKTMTLRQCIEAGRRGAFARVLLRLKDEPTVDNYANALGYADEHNQAALRRALDATLDGSLRFWWWLEEEFPGLRLLDMETDNPFAIVLRGEKEAEPDGD